MFRNNINSKKKFLAVSSHSIAKRPNKYKGTFCDPPLAESARDSTRDRFIIRFEVLKLF